MPPPRVIVLEPYNGGLALARSLVRTGHDVTVVVSEELSYMGHSRGTSARWLAPEEGDSAIGTALAELGKAGPGVVVTGADRSTEWLAANRSSLPDALRTFEGPQSGHELLIGKERAYEIAQAAGVAVPWMRPVHTVDELDEAAREATYPCVLKPVLSHSFRRLFGEERVFLVHDAEEARRSGTPALEAGIEMLMSEYVPGGDGDVEEAIVVRTADGRYPVRFGCRKIRQHPTGFGAASICVADPIEDSMALATAVLDEVGFTGVVGVETKRHAETGRVYFIEANVRLPTQWGLGDAAGVDASRRLVATLAGEALGPQPPLRAGVKLVFPELELPAALSLLRSYGGAGGRAAMAFELLRSYRGTRELGILDLRDPRPLLNRARRLLARRFGRA